LADWPAVLVGDALYRSPGRYTLKVQTPINTYFANKTEAEWRALVDRDLAMRDKQTCPFRNTTVPLNRSCRCGAENENTPQELIDCLVPSSFSSMELMWILAHYDELFKLDPVHGRLCFNLPEFVPQAEGLKDHKLPTTGPGLVPVLQLNHCGIC
jgi:hypothetical protein